MDPEVLAACVQCSHEVRPGSNAVSIYVTCLVCRHHATWKQTGEPTFINYPELRFMKKFWDKLQERVVQPTASMQAAYDEFTSGRTQTRGVSSGTVPSGEPAAVAKAAARPKRTARTTAAPAAVVAAAAASAAAAAESTETLTATVTMVRPRPKGATRAAVPPVVQQTDAAVTTPAQHDYYEDYDWWDEGTPTSSRASSAAGRATAARRTARTSVTDAGS